MAINKLVLAGLTIGLGGIALTDAAADKPVGNFCYLRPLGWNFYCDPEAAQPAPEPAAVPVLPPVVTPPPPNKKTARQEADEIGRQLEELKAEAVLRPTPESVAAYIAFQRQQLNRASTFTDQWRRVLWDNPELDYTLQRPVNTVGKAAWIDQRKALEESSVAALKDRYGIFFFYSSTCVYCQAFSPILKVFAEQHQLNVMAVTRDGVKLPDWPDSVLDSGQSLRLGIADKPVPAVLLFDNQTNQVIEVGYGAMAQDDLRERIYVLTQTEVGGVY
jgi:conjugal transfer pilus assembly protein TraF